MQPASIGLSLLASLALASLASGVHAEPACVPAGAWVAPGGARVENVPAALAARSVVLLGESHEDAEHHRWQLHTVAAMFGHRPDMVLGFEMLPRRVQPVLDRWSNGELSEAAFLRELDWPEIWGHDAELYLPLFHFARMHRLPMLALHVDRATSRRVAAAGLAAVPRAEREDVGEPAPASADYRDRLLEIFRKHPSGSARRRAPIPNSSSALSKPSCSGTAPWPRRSPARGAIGRRSSSASWARAMWSSATAWRTSSPHWACDDVATALPWPVAGACAIPDPRIADAVFGVAPATETREPRRIGVVVSAADAGVRIERVMPQSIAEATGLQAGDVIAQAAGVGLRRPADLVAVIRRQAPGTVLPLQVRRGEVEHEMLARFPAEP